jgi:hypothetical protein
MITSVVFSFLKSIQEAEKQDAATAHFIYG